MRSEYASLEVGLYDWPRSSAAASVSSRIFTSVFVSAAVKIGAVGAEATARGAGERERGVDGKWRPSVSAARKVAIMT